MDKKLPGIFANKIDKKLHNNENVYYSSSRSAEVDDLSQVTEVSSKDDKKSSSPSLNINQKINNIFNSNKYVYKADVSITTKEGKVIKKIIGQNKTHLITMENELIPISDIIDIEFAN